MRGLIRFLIVISCAYAGWQKFQLVNLHQDNVVVVQAEETLSEHARDAIKTCVHGLLKKALPLHEIGSLLRQAFPQLAHVVVSKDIMKRVRVAVQASKPLAVCNESFVLCSNDQLVAKALFSDSYVQTLPSFCVANAQLEQKSSLKAFKEFVVSCDAGLHQNYRIAWNNQHEIFLHDKEHPNITLTVHNNSLQNMESVKLAYNSITQSLLEKSGLKKSKKNQMLSWNIDGRFKNQMIVVPKGVVG